MIQLPEINAAADEKWQDNVQAELPCCTEPFSIETAPEYQNKDVPAADNTEVHGCNLSEVITTG